MYPRGPLTACGALALLLGASVYHILTTTFRGQCRYNEQRMLSQSRRHGDVGAQDLCLGPSEDGMDPGLPSQRIAFSPQSASPAVLTKTL